MSWNSAPQRSVGARRGMLEEALVIWGGGVRGGTTYGGTDDFGFKAQENILEVHDLHATILHLMGFDYEKFTCRYAGRDFRLTDVHGHVVEDVVA